jgi:hypothetical protein
LSERNQALKAKNRELEETNENLQEILNLALESKETSGNDKQLKMENERLKTENKRLLQDIDYATTFQDLQNEKFSEFLEKKNALEKGNQDLKKTIDDFATANETLIKIIDEIATVLEDENDPENKIKRLQEILKDKELEK